MYTYRAIPECSVRPLRYSHCRVTQSLVVFYQRKAGADEKENAQFEIPELIKKQRRERVPPVRRGAIAGER